MSSEYGHVIDVDINFDAAVDKVTNALEMEGFGVLARMDIDEAFRETLGLDFRRYSILGACNPKLAHKALSMDPDAGTVLPCNVCVEEVRDGSRIYIANPSAVIAAGGFDDNAEMHDLGVDASARLARAAARIMRFGTSY